MANNDKLNKRTSNKIQNLADNIQKGMDNVYKATNFSTPQMSKDLEMLGRQINANIDKIVDSNMRDTGYSSVSKLYSRMLPAKDLTDGNVASNIQQMLDDPMAMEDLYTSFMSNKYLIELDNEIDTVLRYMPSLAEALEVKKDNVLSADYFSKDFLTIRSKDLSDDTTFSERIERIKDQYKLLTLAEDVYDKTAKYGERFIYIVPYKTAIAKLLNNKATTGYDMGNRSGFGTFRESFDSLQSSYENYRIDFNKDKFSIVSEAGEVMSTSKPMVLIESVTSSGETKVTQKPILGDNEKFTINIELCRSGIIESVVIDSARSFKQRNTLTESYSLSNQFINEVALTEANKDDKLSAKGNLTLGTKSTGLYSQDGLIGSNDKKDVKLKNPGCIVKQLERANVILSYIDDMCMGYYYLEVTPGVEDPQIRSNSTTMANMLGGNSNSIFANVDKVKQDDMLRYISGELSRFIDKNFVNNNQDLSKEIYMVLKYNDLFNSPNASNIRVTYIAPDDMVHVFFKQDEKTKRGISDLDKSLVPATIYCSLYLNDAIGSITRGNDKRAYYVKQNVEQNIAKTMLTTIAQIKQGNFGIRQFQNINNVLNITGKFNDYVIPMGPSGEAPIQFEVIPGQQFEPHTELLDRLNDMAIGGTGVPNEIIETRKSIDYAMQLSMSSSKFLRHLYNRQSGYQDFLSVIVTKIYNYQYDENESLEASLPPPSFLNITNTSQIVDNTANFAENIVNNELPDESDELKMIAKKHLFKHYIGSHLNGSAHEALYRRARLELKKKNNETGDSSDSY